MRRSRLLYITCLSLLCWQATAQNLVYSVSYAETQSSFAARYGARPFLRPVNERLAMLRRYRKTEIYSVSVTDGKRVLLFTDEGKNFEILPPTIPGEPLISATKACLKGVEREWRMSPTPGAYSTPESMYEISLDGSNSFRRLFETKPNLSAAVVNPIGTKALFQSMEDGKYIVYIYDVANWNLVRSWDLSRLLQAHCQDCLPNWQGWLSQDHGLFFKLDLGDEDSISPNSHNEPGLYITDENGTSSHTIPANTGQWQMPGYKRETWVLPTLIGQLSDGTFAFVDYAVKQPPPKPPAQAVTFLILTKLSSPAEKAIPISEFRLESFHVSPSGRYLAYTEARITRDYRTERHLMVKDLQSEQERELLFEPPPNLPSSPEPNHTFMVLGWMPER